MFLFSLYFLSFRLSRGMYYPPTGSPACSPIRKETSHLFSALSYSSLALLSLLVLSLAIHLSAENAKHPTPRPPQPPAPIRLWRSHRRSVFLTPQESNSPTSPSRWTFPPGFLIVRISVIIIIINTDVESSQTRQYLRHDSFERRRSSPGTIRKSRGGAICEFRVAGDFRGCRGGKGDEG